MNVGISRTSRRARVLVATAVAMAIGLGGAPVASAAETPPPSRDVRDFACPLSEVPAAGFVDTADNLFELEIDCLAWYGITRGGPGGRPANEYGPSLSVTRAQMATFLVKFVDYVDETLVAGYDNNNRFDDVADNGTHVASINRLAVAGIVTGGANGGPATDYAPLDAVSRDQMASFIARTLKLILNGNICVENPDYFDDDDASVHSTCINGLADTAIASGTGGGNFSPEADVTRAQMAAFLMRAMDLLVQQELAFPPAS